MKQNRFGAFLNKARINAGYTQLDVAKRLKYKTSQYISNYERGRCLPSIPALHVMIKMYGISRQYVVAHLVALERSRITREFTKINQG